MLPLGQVCGYPIQKNIFCGAFFLGDTVPKQWMVLMLDFMNKKLTRMTVRSFLGHNLTVKGFRVRDSAAVAELVDAQR